MGLCMAREGSMEACLRSLASSQRLRKRGFSRSLYARLSNGYGMPRRGSALEDDRAAFFSIQISRYLGRRIHGTFSSECERDMVYALVEDSWMELCRSGILSGRSHAAKMVLFKAVRIVFPLPSPEAGMEDGIIDVDFRKGRPVSLASLCPCGSGLSYLRCCGRLESPEYRYKNMY
jgi:hypothetical protein